MSTSMQLCAVLALALAAAASATPSRQVHIAAAGDAGNAVTVSWLDNTRLSPMLFRQTGASSWSTYGRLVVGKSYSYTSYYTGSYTSALIHHVRIGGLAYGTEYEYVIGTDASATPTTFTTAPKPAAEQPYVFSVMGDLGQTNDSASTVNHILADDTAGYTLLVGDLSYADSQGNPAEGRNCTQKRWDSWGAFIEPLASTRQLMLLPGNHEMEQEGPLPATQEMFVAYQARFAMPSKESGATSGNLYYSFDVASAHVIFLNSYMDFNVSSPQYDWLVADLKAVDRSATPWLIACMHAPWYNSNQHHHNEVQEVYMRQTMEPLFHQYNVDLVLAGHVHAYERTRPMFNNVSTPGATTFINIGDAGNREGPCPEWFTAPSWSAYRESAFGHGRLEIKNSTHMGWTWHKITEPESQVGDAVWLVKNQWLGRGVQTGVSAQRMTDADLTLRNKKTA